MSMPSQLSEQTLESRTEPQAPGLLARQLKHHVRNVLHRMAVEIYRNPGLKSASWGRESAEQLVSRLCLAAEVSDQLLDFHSDAASLAERLRSLGRNIVAVLGSPGQEIGLDVLVKVDFPFALRGILLRAANEMIGNAVRHGMAERRAGRIEIVISESAERELVLVVRDDGWGLLPLAIEGEGSQLIRGLSAPYRGKYTLRRCGDWTESVLTLPRECGDPDASSPA